MNRFLHCFQNHFEQRQQCSNSKESDISQTTFSCSSLYDYLVGVLDEDNLLVICSRADLEKNQSSWVCNSTGKSQHNLKLISCPKSSYKGTSGIQSTCLFIVSSYLRLLWPLVPALLLQENEHYICYIMGVTGYLTLSNRVGYKFTQGTFPSAVFDCLTCNPTWMQLATYGTFGIHPLVLFSIRSEHCQN